MMLIQKLMKEASKHIRAGYYEEDGDLISLDWIGKGGISSLYLTPVDNSLEYSRSEGGETVEYIFWMRIPNGKNMRSTHDLDIEYFTDLKSLLDFIAEH